MCLRFARLLLAGALMCTGLFSATIVIDDFDSTQSLGTLSTLGMVDGGQAAAGVFGGSRYARLDNLTGGGAATLNVNQTASGLLEFGQDPAVSASFLLIWDGDTDDTLEFTNTLGDLVSTSNNRIRVSYRSDLSIPVTITVYTDAANWSSATFNTTSTGFGSNPFANVDLFFATSFTFHGGTGADFSNVRAITMSGTGASQPGADIQVDFIRAYEDEVPEPATYLLLGAGLIAFATARRKAER